MPRILFDGWKGFTFVKKRRKINPYFYHDNAVIDATYSEDDPSWRGWLVAFISLLTAINTVDLALTGLELAVSLPLIVNIGLTLVNIGVAISILWNTVVELVTVPENVFQQLAKLSIAALVGYGLAIAALATLAAVTPGANVVLAAVFVANAVAIGVNVVHALSRAILPWLQKVMKRRYKSFWGKRVDPIQLTPVEKQILSSNDAFYHVQCSNRDVFKTLRDKGIKANVSGQNETADKTYALRTRRAFATFFKVERERCLSKHIASSMTKSQEAKQYAEAQKLVIKEGKLWEQTKPFNLYLGKLSSLTTKLAYDLRSIHYIKLAYQAYQDNQTVANAHALLKKITGSNSIEGEAHITLDKLKYALTKLDPKRDSSEKYITCVNRYVIFNTPVCDLSEMVDEIIQMATQCVQERFFKKLLKLHDRLGLNADDIVSVLDVKLQTMIAQEPALEGINDQDNLQSLIDILKAELQLRSHPCPLEYHHCIGEPPKVKITSL